METTPILLAEADPDILSALDRPLCEAIPRIDLHVSRSVDEAAHKLQKFHFNTIITSTPFLLAHNHQLLHTKRALQSLTPLIVTVGGSDRTQAHEILESGTFTILTRPIDPSEAVKAVRLALWQNRLLRLIASREKALSTFRKHLEAFPNDWKSEEIFMRTLSIMEKTFLAFGTSIQRIEETHDKFLYDVAVSVDLHSRQRALERLFKSASTERMN